MGKRFVVTFLFFLHEEMQQATQIYNNVAADGKVSYKELKGIAEDHSEQANDSRGFDAGIGTF